MKIHRTYPQPDSPQPHLGPRERAMAVYKYLLDLEPEVAAHHPRFGLIVAAFEQQHRLGWNAREVSSTPGKIALPDSIAPLLSGSSEAPAVVRPFGKAERSEA